MKTQRITPDDEGEDVERCRRAREAFVKRFSSLDEMFDHCKRLERRRKRECARGLRTRVLHAHPPATQGKLARETTRV